MIKFVNRVVYMYWVALLLVACGSNKDIPIPDSDSVVKTYIFPDDFTNDLVGKEVTLKMQCLSLLPIKGRQQAISLFLLKSYVLQLIK